MALPPIEPSRKRPRSPPFLPRRPAWLTPLPEPGWAPTAPRTAPLRVASGANVGSGATVKDQIRRIISTIQGAKSQSLGEAQRDCLSAPFRPEDAYPVSGLEYTALLTDTIAWSDSLLDEREISNDFMNSSASDAALRPRQCAQALELLVKWAFFATQFSESASIGMHQAYDSYLAETIAEWEASCDQQMAITGFAQLLDSARSVLFELVRGIIRQATEDHHGARRQGVAPRFLPVRRSDTPMPDETQQKWTRAAKARLQPPGRGSHAPAPPKQSASHSFAQSAMSPPSSVSSAGEPRAIHQAFSEFARNPSDGPAKYAASQKRTHALASLRQLADTVDARMPHILKTFCISFYAHGHAGCARGIQCPRVHVTPHEIQKADISPTGFAEAVNRVKPKPRDA